MNLTKEQYYWNVLRPQMLKNYYANCAKMQAQAKQANVLKAEVAEPEPVVAEEDADAAESEKVSDSAEKTYDDEFDSLFDSIEPSDSEESV